MKSILGILLTKKHKINSLLRIGYHTAAETKWPQFPRRYFQMHFPGWKCINLKCSLNFVSNGPINTIPSLVQVMAGRRPSDKPLSEIMLVSLLTYICVNRAQWVKYTYFGELDNSIIFVYFWNSIWWKDIHMQNNVYYRQIVYKSMCVAK